MRNRQLQPGFHQLQAPEYSCSLSLLCNMPTLIKLMQMGQALGGSLKLSSVYKLRLYISAPCLEVCQKQAIYTMLIFYYTACKQRPIYAKYKESMLSAQFLELFCMLLPSDQRDGQGSALYFLLLLLFIHTFRQRHMFRKVSVNFLWPPIFKSWNHQFCLFNLLVDCTNCLIYRYVQDCVFYIYAGPHWLFEPVAVYGQRLRFLLMRMISNQCIGIKALYITLAKKS